jgi:hypothetical protein
MGIRTSKNNDDPQSAESRSANPPGDYAYSTEVFPQNISQPLSGEGRGPERKGAGDRA